MTQIKIFAENFKGEMEKNVNNWLENHSDVQVRQVLQHIYADKNDIPWIILTIIYDLPIS